MAVKRRRTGVVRIVLLAAIFMVAWVSSSALTRWLSATRGQPNGWAPPQSTSSELLMPPASATQLDAAVCEFLDAADSVAVHAETALTRDAEPSDELDAEWSLLPRTAGSIEACLHLLPTATARRMFRCTQLNPRDKYIPPPVRAELEAALAAMEPALGRIREGRQRVYSQIADEARSQGLFRELHVQPRNIRTKRGHPAGEGVELAAVSVAELQKAGADMGTFVGGRFYGASKVEFRAGRQMLDIERFVGCELVVQVVSWFERIAVLEREEAELLREAAFR